MLFRIAACLVAVCAETGELHADQTYQLSPDDGMVTYFNGNQAAIRSSDCKEDGESVVSDFQKKMAEYKQPGRLVACQSEVVTDYPSIYDTHYYAGIFTLDLDGKRSKVAACYNEGTGDFVLKPISSLTHHELIVFMMDNCTSG